MNNPVQLQIEKPAQSGTVRRGVFRSGWRRSIVFKLTLLVASVVVLTAGTLVLVSYVCARWMLEEEIHDHLKSVAASRSAAVAQFGKQQTERIRLVVSRTRLRTLLSESDETGTLDHRDRLQIETILRDALTSTADFRAICVVDPQGRVLASTAPHDMQRHFSRDPDFQAGLRGFHLGEPRRVGDAMEAYLSGPAWLHDRLLGVVMVRLDMSGLRKILGDTTEIGKSGMTMVGRRDGARVHFLMPPVSGSKMDAPARLVPMLAIPTLATSGEVELSAQGELEPELGKGRHGFYEGRYFVYQGRRVLAARLPLDYASPGSPWVLVTQLDVAEAYAPVARLGWLLIAFGTAMLLVGVAVSYWIAQRFTRPILTMVETATAITAGKLGAQADVDSRDEIGGLAEALNAMSLRLAQVQDELECRVVERTQQLAEANRKLQQARRHAEQANHAKSEFLAGMSRQIRTPLNALLGMTQLVLDTPLTDSQRKYLETVQEAGDTLLTVISEVFDFSRIEANKLELEPAMFDLREWVGDTAKLMALPAREKHIELVCHMALDTPRFVVGDAGRLRQVLLNLLSNAIKFTDHGEVVLRTRLDSRKLGEVVVCFEVTDTGVGVPKERRGAIFAAFGRADVSTSRRFGGTGLGLAIAARLVHLMGGQIGVRDHVEQGSCFYFTACFQPAAEGPAPNTRRSPYTPPSEIQTALEFVHGRDGLCLELAVIAVEESPKIMTEIEQALSNGDFKTLKCSAHSLHGSLRYFGDQPVTDLARELETRAGQNQADNCRRLVADLRPAMERLLRILLDYTIVNRAGRT